MEPQTLADFFSRFSGTVPTAKPKKPKNAVIPPSKYNYVIYRLDLPNNRALQTPNPRNLVKLKLILKSKSQREVAQAIGVSVSNLSYYVNGRGKVRGWDELDAKIKNYIA
uniref:Helix-turn-helix transcriptional regulator n=1 Tax=Clandestinovirus TaxID=2831644 RepID=A0A8F8PMJ6_9VIRU|nr:helix-turn-helix transcriptional regulator [Clandestinovirus]